MFYKHYYRLFKIIYIFSFLITLFYIYNKIFFQKTEQKIFNKNTNIIKIKSLYDLLNTTINISTILIFELKRCHHECIPGYTKYFIDLGYNVDILMHIIGINSLCMFQEIQKIRVFLFDNITEIKMNSEKISSIIKKYNFVLLQSADKKEKKLYNKLDLLNINNSIFVFHEIGYSDNDFSKYFKQNRIWTLGNISKGLLVNPHYFGNIKLREKNYITRFFLTSTIHRNYKILIEATKKLKKENYNFEIIITGRSNTFNSSSIPKNLKDKYIFKLRVSFNELYKLVESSDFIILTFDSNNKFDKSFRTSRVTGSYQLSNGFLKPCIINEKFSYFYNLNDKNSIIYEDLNLYKAMKKTILLTNKEYKKIQNNLQISEKELYSISINNMRKIIRK